MVSHYRWVALWVELSVSKPWKWEVQQQIQQYTRALVWKGDRPWHSMVHALGLSLHWGNEFVNSTYDVTFNVAFCDIWDTELPKHFWVDVSCYWMGMSYTRNDKFCETITNSWGGTQGYSWKTWPARESRFRGNCECIPRIHPKTLKLCALIDLRYVRYTTANWEHFSTVLRCSSAVLHLLVVLKVKKYKGYTIRHI